MEFNVFEVQGDPIVQPCLSADAEVYEIDDLRLSLVGGGCAEVCPY